MKNTPACPIEATAFEAAGLPEPKHAHDRTWTDKSPDLQRAAYENRRRMRRAKGKGLGRVRSEGVERSYAYVCDSGGMRRSWLRGLVDVTKRYMIAAVAHNLGRIRRRLFGVGKPKSLQGLRSPRLCNLSRRRSGSRP